MPVSRVRNVGNDTVDLGEVVELAQIRPAAITRGPWLVRPLPEEIWISEGDANGNAPPVDGAGWTKITQPAEWVLGVRTGNYGETAPIEQDAQVINLDGVKARYVRAQNVGNLVFMDRNSRGSYLPMTLQLDGDTLYVLPRIWPKFVGWIQYWEDKLAALDLSGKERFSFTSTQKMLDVQLLNLPGASKKQPVVATVDGRIDVVGHDGSLEKEIPFLKLHEQYNTDFGRPNTRHPAGGFAMPFAIGMWKPDPKAEPGMVVARYHSFSFLDSGFKLDGILAEGMYVQPALLPQGIDFDGDGAEEQVTLTRGIIAQVHGPRDQRITEPTGFMFFPQVYHIKRLEEPAWDERIDGPSVILFEALQTASSAPGRPRYVAVVRDGYAGIYDGLENKWAFTWVPAAPITAATLAQDSANRVRLLIATSDSILWIFDFAGAFDKPSPSARSFAEQIVGLRGDSATPGSAFIMGQSALYHIDPNQALERIKDGRFIDALRLPGDHGIAVTGLDGSVTALGAKKP